tara:strand:+ start:364 stop:702 length:339 start_codon:yes stop_codon:yes gene_type:complete
MNNEKNNQWRIRPMTGFSFYCWDNGQPVRSDEVIRLSEESQCFVTGEPIPETDNAHWTDEFDAWISVDGYNEIMDAQTSGEIRENREWQIIYAEWYAKDEAEAGQQEMRDYE